MRIVFLDFDGVILTAESRLGKTLPVSSGRTIQAYFEDCAVLYKPEQSKIDLLNEITETTKASIIVTSNWRRGLNLNRLRKLLSSWGVKGKVLGVTPTIGLRMRFNEIAQWLKNRSSVESYVILDDHCEGLLSEMQYRLVLSTFSIGLTPELKDKAIEILAQVREDICEVA